MKRNLFIRLAYQGTKYAGWQIQPTDETVQGTLVGAFQRLFQTDDFELFGSSRTDAGVHALDQCVNFRPPLHPPITTEGILKASRGLLPPDISVRSVEEMPEDFHVRHSNCGKAYTYLIHRGPVVSPFCRDFLWPVKWELDVEAMRGATAALIGEQDFAAFTVALKHQEIRSTIRELNRFVFTEYGDVLAITVVGGSFLYKMVRRIIGYLVEVGRGRFGPDDTIRILQAGANGATFITAPPEGLFLERVFFDAAELDYEPDGLPFLQLLKLA